MSLSAGTVSIGVKPDTSKFGIELKDGLLGKMSGVGENLGSMLLKGMGLVGIASTIGGALKTGFSELSDASAGTAQLAAGIKSTGNAAGVSVDSLNSLASSIQNYSGQTDDSIVKSEQLLLTFTNVKNGVGAGNDIFNQATKATADMAAKMGGDASGAAIQLGKALNDPVKGITALSRVGVSFTDQQKNQIKAMVAAGDTMGAQKIILGELNKEFGGSAEAYGNSMPGMIARSKRAFEDLTQALAGGLLPIITPVLEGLLKGFQKVQPFIQTFADNTGKWLSGLGPKLKPMFDFLGDAFKPLMAAFKDLWPSIQALVPQVLGLVSAFSPMGLLFKTIKPELPALVKMFAGLAETIDGALIKALQEILPPISKVIDVLVTTGSKVLAELMPTLMKLVGIFGGILADVIKQLAPIIVILVNAVASLLPPLMPVIETLVQLVIKAVLPLVAALRPLIDAVLPIFVGLIKFLVPIITFLAQVIETILVVAIQIVIKVVQFIINYFTNVIKVFTNVIGVVKNLGKFWGDVFGAIYSIVTGNFGKAIDFVKDGVNSIVDALNNAIDGVNVLLDGVKGLTGGAINLHIAHIPHLAQGGIVPATPGGRIVKVAEAGEAEAVIPLSKLGSMGGKGTTINYYAAKNDSIDAQQKLVDAVYRAKVLGAI
jgi:phage-related protein